MRSQILRKTNATTHCKDKRSTLKAFVILKKNRLTSDVVYVLLSQRNRDGTMAQRVQHLLENKVQCPRIT